VTRLDERSAAGIALGAAGLFMFNIVCGPFAVGLGFSAYRRAGRRGQRAAALLSIVLGLADLVVLAVLVAGRFHDGQFRWSG
jgi:hypothetical protein